jgi:uncharacterized protein YwbE
VARRRRRHGGRLNRAGAAKRWLIPLLAAAALGAAGCGSSESSDTPAACLSGSGTYLKALEAAPGDVRLDGSVAIGDCLVEEQGAGEIADVGKSMIAAATRLNAEGRHDPAGPAPVELGYLVGVIEQAADSTGGIHQDLVRRIETAARFAPHGQQLPPQFSRGFGQGFAAGQAGG